MHTRLLSLRLKFFHVIKVSVQCCDILFHIRSIFDRDLHCKTNCFDKKSTMSLKIMPDQFVQKVRTTNSQTILSSKECLLICRCRAEPVHIPHIRDTRLPELTHLRFQPVFDLSRLSELDEGSSQMLRVFLAFLLTRHHPLFWKAKRGCFFSMVVVWKVLNSKSCHFWWNQLHVELLNHIWIGTADLVELTNSIVLLFALLHPKDLFESLFSSSVHSSECIIFGMDSERPRKLIRLLNKSNARLPNSWFSDWTQSLSPFPASIPRPRCSCARFRVGASQSRFRSAMVPRCRCLRTHRFDVFYFPALGEGGSKCWEGTKLMKKSPCAAAQQWPTINRSLCRGVPDATQPPNTQK